MPTTRPAYNIKYSTDAEGKVTFLNDLSEFEDKAALYTYTLFCVPFETFVTRLDEYTLTFIELYCIRNKLSKDQITAVVALVQGRTPAEWGPGNYYPFCFFLDAPDSYRAEDIYFYDEMISKSLDEQTVHMFQTRKLCYIIANSSCSDALKHFKEAIKILSLEVILVVIEFCKRTKHVYCIKYITEELARTHDEFYPRGMAGLHCYVALNSHRSIVKLDDVETSDIRIVESTVMINATRVPGEIAKYFI